MAPSGDRHQLNLQRRLAWLEYYGALDSACEAEFNNIVRSAARICGTPIALISLIDRDRQWFKAEIGFGVTQTTLDKSICAKAIEHDGVFVVENAELDPRVNANPLVWGSPGIRFYAGVPLLAPDGSALGMLCVLDIAPRAGGLSPCQVSALQQMAGQVMALLTRRRTEQNQTATKGI